MNNYKTLSTLTLNGTRITLLEFASGKDLENSENHFILKTVTRHKPTIQEFEDKELAKDAYLSLVKSLQ